MHNGGLITEIDFLQATKRKTKDFIYKAMQDGAKYTEKLTMTEKAERMSINKN